MYYRTNDIAQLLVRAHSELRNVLAHALPAVTAPLSLELSCGQATTSLEVQSNQEKIAMRFRDGDRTYTLTLPLHSDSPDFAKAIVELSDSRVSKTMKFSIPDFMNSNLPDEFQSLHETVRSHLRNILPKRFLEEGTGLNPNAAPAVKVAPTVEANTADTASVAASTDADSQSAAKTAGADADNAPKYHRVVVEREKAPDLVFEGRLKGRVLSRVWDGRQWEYLVFETRSGKQIGIKHGITLILGERNRVQSVVATSDAELVAFFGYDALAKVLYQQLGISAQEVID